MREKKAKGLAGLLTSERWADATVSVLAIILMLVAASGILLLLGKNPATAFYSFLQGCGLAPKANYGGGSGMLSDLFNYLNILAPISSPLVGCTKMIRSACSSLSRPTIAF